MLYLGCGEKKTSSVEFLKDLGIAAYRTCLDFCLGGLASHSGKRSLVPHHAVLIHHLYKRSVVFTTYSRIVFTESGSDMYDSGTVGHRYIVIAVYEECFLMLLFNGIGSALVEWLVFLVLKVLTRKLLDDFVYGSTFLVLEHAEYGIGQSLCEDIGVAVAGFGTDIGIFGIHAQSDVGCERPGCGRPNQEVGIIIFGLETYDSGTLF